jgi:integrase
MPKIVRDAADQYSRLGFSGAVLPAGFVFPSGPGSSTPISVRNIQLIIAKASKDSIGLQFSPHALRHTYATRMMKLTDLPTLQRLMGHTSLKSTEIYTHPSNQDMIDASRRMDEMNKGL